MAEFAGIDVSKEHLDVALHEGKHEWRCSHDDTGLDALAKELASIGPELIVLEATSGFEMIVLAALTIARLPVAVVNPRNVRDFAKTVIQVSMIALSSAWVSHWTVPSFAFFRSKRLDSSSNQSAPEPLQELALGKGDEARAELFHASGDAFSVAH